MGVDAGVHRGAPEGCGSYLSKNFEYFLLFVISFSYIEMRAYIDAVGLRFFT